MEKANPEEITKNIPIKKKNRPALKKILIKENSFVAFNSNLSNSQKLSKNVKSYEDLDLSREIDESRITPISEILLDNSVSKDSGM